MIKLGIIQKCEHSPHHNHAYAVTIPMNDTEDRTTFFVNNPNDIPNDLRVALDYGESIAGIFKVNGLEDFAEYIPERKVIIQINSD